MGGCKRKPFLDYVRSMRSVQTVPNTAGVRSLRVRQGKICDILWDFKLNGKVNSYNRPI